jgi:hypothetical protein
MSVMDSILLDQPSTGENKWDYTLDNTNIVVIDLGTNDFSTPLNPTVDRWSDHYSLKLDWLENAHEMLNNIQSAYGVNTPIIFITSQVDLTAVVSELVQARSQNESEKVSYLDVATIVNQRTGCHWHPSVDDHRGISQALINRIQEVYPIIPDPDLGDWSKVSAQDADVVISWNWGAKVVVEGFDTLSDTIFIDWYKPENIEITEEFDGVKFTMLSNGNQTLLLKGVTLAALSSRNFRIRDTLTANKVLALLQQSDLKPKPKLDQGNWSNVSQDNAEVLIDWNWGAQTIIEDFNIASDRIFITWVNPENLMITELNGDLIFTLPSNGGQSITLQGVTLLALSSSNFHVKTGSTADKILTLLRLSDWEASQQE